MSDQLSPFISTHQAAKRIGLTVNTLKRLRITGSGPPFLKISKRTVLYDEQKFDAWVRSREHTSTSEYDAAAA